MIDARVLRLSQHRACREPLAPEALHSSAVFTALTGAPMKYQLRRRDIKLDDHRPASARGPDAPRGVASCAPLQLRLGQQRRLEESALSTRHDGSLLTRLDVSFLSHG